MTDFAHGSKAGALLDGRDLTRYTTDFNFTTDIDVAEQTCLMADGGAKEYLYGNTGASAGLDGRLAKSRVQLEREMDALRGEEESGKLFLQAPAGFAPGRPAIIFQTLKSRLGVKGGLTSVNSTGMSFVADGVARVATMLLAPRVQGGANVTRNEVQILTFNNASSSQFFGLRASGTTQFWPFQLSSYGTDAALAAAIKTGVEGLAAYNGRTVTVTVLTPRSGTTALSLALQIEFDGAVNVAQLEAISGAVDSFVVAGGDDGNYSSNGGADFTLGINEGAYQTNQRNLGGERQDVVCKGSSVAPTSPASLPLTVDPTNTSSSSGFLIDGTLTGPATAHVPDGDVCVFDLGSLQKVGKVQTFDQAAGGFSGGTAQIQGSVTSDFANPINMGVANSSPKDNTWTDVPNSSTGNANIRYVRFIASGEWSLSEMRLLGISSPGNANFKSYYPLNRAPGAPTAAGTGATNTRTLATGAMPTSLNAATTQEGGAFTGLNLVTSAQAFSPVKTADAATNSGATVDLHAPFTSTGSLNVPVVIEHAPDNAGAPGAWATLATFATITDATNRDQLAQRIVLSTGTLVQPWLRVRVPTLTGSAALGVALARKPS